MRKCFFLFVVVLFIAPAFCFAGNEVPDELFSLVNIKLTETNQDAVSGLFGKPDKTESTHKQSVWYYSNEKHNIIIYWNNRTSTVDKCSFSAIEDLAKIVLDRNKANLLKSGQTSLSQAIKILGTPKDMLIKSANQELHYAFQNNTLNLFFRGGMLVNYTLY